MGVVYERESLVDDTPAEPAASELGPRVVTVDAGPEQDAPKPESEQGPRVIIDPATREDDVVITTGFSEQGGITFRDPAADEIRARAAERAKTAEKKKEAAPKRRTARNKARRSSANK